MSKFAFVDAFVDAGVEVEVEVEVDMDVEVDMVVGTSAPGFKMPPGSNARINARTTSTPAPSAAGRRGAFDRPTPWW